MEKIIRVKGLFEIREGDYVDVIMPFVSVAVILHVFSPPTKAIKGKAGIVSLLGNLGSGNTRGSRPGPLTLFVTPTRPPPPIIFSVSFNGLNPVSAV